MMCLLRADEDIESAVCSEIAAICGTTNKVFQREMRKQITDGRPQSLPPFAINNKSNLQVCVRIMSVTVAVAEVGRG